MREYLAVFSLIGLSVGIVAFTWVFLADTGMQYSQYRALISVLLSFTTLISNAAMSYYFAKKTTKGRRSPKIGNTL
jgi:hypothetical protein